MWRRRNMAFDGTGIGVAIIDSGIATHPDLNNANGVSRVVYSQSFVSGDSDDFRISSVTEPTWPA